MHHRRDPASLLPPSLRSTSADLHPTGNQDIPKKYRKQDPDWRGYFHFVLHLIEAMIRQSVIPSAAKRLLVALAPLAACKTEKAPPQDSTRATANVTPGQGTASGPDSAAHKLGVLAQMKTPESVHYDADLDAWFISNINGNPSQHDGNGYIVRVAAESTTTVTMFAEGGKNGVKLDAPKGIMTTTDQ